MLITTVPRHIAGLMGQPRRYASFDYPDPSLAKTAPLVLLSVVGGALVLCSVLLFFYVLLRSSPTPVAEFMPPVRYAIAVHPPAAVPRLLNGFAFWNVMLLVLMVIAYAYPIASFAICTNTTRHSRTTVQVAKLSLGAHVEIAVVAQK